MRHQKPKEPPRGPRGGKTTVSVDGSHIRKTYFLPVALENAIRDEAHETRRPESDIVREQLALRYPELADRGETPTKKPPKKKSKSSRG